MLPATIPSSIGVKKLPLVVAERPRTPWKKRGIKMKLANMPKAVKKITSSETTTIRLRNSDMGMMGSAVLVSMTINRRAVATEKANIPRMVPDSQG